MRIYIKMSELSEKKNGILLCVSNGIFRNGGKMNNRLLILMKHRGLNRMMAVILTIAMLVCGSGIERLSVKAEAATGYTTLYFVDNTPEHWIGNDNAIIELVDNTYGHDRYVMSTNDRSTWSVRVPKSTYNVTFNRYDSSKTIQWNSWSAGGRDGYTTYYVYGHEYGFWGGDKDTEEGFKAGDVIYLDFYEFSGWKQSDAGFYVNFTDASKKENGGRDIDINTADKTKFSPVGLVNEAEDDVFTYIVTEEEAGSTELRFWRGNDDTLWNCSVILSYKEFKAGNNCVKIQGWDDTGYVCPYVPRRHITKIDSMELEVSGNRKVNRKLVLDFNITGETERLVKEDTRIIVSKNNNAGVENYNESEATEEQCVLFDETASAWNHRELIVKESGTYTITAVATDGVEDFTTETTVVIVDDMVPVADYRLSEDSHIYTRDENGVAYVDIIDCSVSEQGDAIVSRIYEIYYDADFDGIYSEDEKIDTIDGNETEVSLKLTSVGKYKVKLSVQEHFEDTIEAIIDESEYLCGNTEDRSIEDVTFEVTNLAPSSSMSIQKSRLANIIFTVGDADSEILEQYIRKCEDVKEYLESQGIQANVSTVSTSSLTAQDTFAWKEYDHYDYDDFLLPMIPKHILYHDRDIIMMGYSMSPMKDFLYVEENDSGRKVFEFDLQRDSTDCTVWRVEDFYLTQKYQRMKIIYRDIVFL